ncbi:MAG: hypothetical protein ACREJ4_16065, partial [Candidatus Methylomirabilaceae bacterium]
LTTVAWAAVTEQYDRADTDGVVLDSPASSRQELTHTESGAPLPGRLTLAHKLRPAAAAVKEDAFVVTPPPQAVSFMRWLDRWGYERIVT